MSFDSRLYLQLHRPTVLRRMDVLVVTVQMHDNSFRDTLPMHLLALLLAHPFQRQDERFAAVVLRVCLVVVARRSGWAGGEAPAQVVFLVRGYGEEMVMRPGDVRRGIQLQEACGALRREIGGSCLTPRTLISALEGGQIASSVAEERMCRDCHAGEPHVNEVRLLMRGVGRGCALVREGYGEAAQLFEEMFVVERDEKATACEFRDLSTNTHALRHTIIYA